ncbi:MAG: cytochrome C [Sulfurimonas sp.]|uniref:cytochrome C n=1 Tax=Sulfurimonas sp. TaxID=2022749 RepID=UPI00260E4EE4|nr:cytochrome C [Sulfurimonas sp.]MDD5400040.1 cytochrome C [Sulfurimonas sp.]
MGKFFIFSLFMVVFALSNADAALHKGQKEYLKQCSKCHPGGQTFISKKYIREWEQIMKNNGEELAKVHLSSSDEKAKPSHEYFKNKESKDNAVHLMQFLMEYAKDSGKVPACN